MDKIRQWTLTVSAVSIMSGVLISALPKSMHKNYFKLITSIILIYVLMQPLLGKNIIDFNISDFLNDNYKVSENIDKYAMSSMINSAEKAIEDLFYTKAEENNIECRFECDCALSNDEIAVKRIKVTPDLNEAERQIIENWSVSLGFDISIVAFEGENNE